MEFGLPRNVASSAYVLPQSQITTSEYRTNIFENSISFSFLLLLLLLHASVRLCSLEAGDGYQVATTTTSPVVGGSNACRFFQRIRARNVCHVYLDYASTYVVVSTLPLLLALYLQQDDESQKQQDGGGAFHRNNNVMSTPLILTAMVGGTLLSFGNLSFQWATSVYGAPLTTVLAMQASLTVILGTSLNYLLQPSKTPRPGWLLLGVVVFLLAIALATTAQFVYATERHEYQKQQFAAATTKTTQRVPPTAALEYTTIELQYGSNHYKRRDSDAFTVVDEDSDAATTTLSESRYQAEQRNRTGVLIAVAGGLCFGFFSPAFNIAVNDPFGWSHAAITVTDASLLVFYANLWFSLAFGVASVVGNLILLKYELHAQSVTDILWSYLTQASWTDRRVALLAGLVCAAGNVLQFHGGQLVGYATADLVQAYPLVSTLWDILYFGEFAHVKWCCSWLSLLLMAMYAAYLGGIVLLAVSSME